MVNAMHAEIKSTKGLSALIEKWLKLVHRICRELRYYVMKTDISTAHITHPHISYRLGFEHRQYFQC